ncbi:hypothetical protein DL765_001206 [Monosporascus sp. GIB2]|nr:hypothetical protein DL765_001206 [Monosporascus sp. GIB2]
MQKLQIMIVPQRRPSRKQRSGSPRQSQSPEPSRFCAQRRPKRRKTSPGGHPEHVALVEGDELKFAEAEDMVRQIVGHDMSCLWSPLGRDVRRLVDDAGESMNWFERVGFVVNIKALWRKDE